MGWRKRWWLVVLERTAFLARAGGVAGAGVGVIGGSHPNLHAHLHSSSSCSFKRVRSSGYNCSNYYYNRGAVACVALLVVLAFFYVSVANGPIVDASFPSSPSSPAAILSWFSSSSRTLGTPPDHVVARRARLPPHPPHPRSLDGAENLAAEDAQPLQRTTTTGEQAMPRSNSSNAAAGSPGEPGRALPPRPLPNAGPDGIQNSTKEGMPPSERIAIVPSPLPGHHKEGENSSASIGSGPDGARAEDARYNGIIAYKYRSETERFRRGQSRNESRGAGESSGKAVDSFKSCDLYNGRWVRDESYPFYPPGSCPPLDDDFNCHKNGRQDTDFLKWRWLPYDCDIPRLNATDFLERLRGKRIIFVGDSLNRNMWESLVCILRHNVSNKNNVYEVSGRSQFKTKGYYSFKFKDYKCSIDFVRSIFLVKELIHEKEGKPVEEKLKLDELDETTAAYRGADIVVFNTGHWWTHSKTSKGINYYKEGNHVYPNLDVMEAFKKALNTWARWIDRNIDSRRTQVVFRGYSLTHFGGGQWNSGGKCHKETEPIFNQSYLTEYPAKMKALEQVLGQMKTPVIYMNISRLTDYRKDGHPSIYRMRYNTVKEQMAAIRRQDCSHWCLPGVPDSWNELLYASLLRAGKGSWRL